VIIREGAGVVQRQKFDRASGRARSAQGRRPR
jgi:hypothetical protein